MRKSISEMKLSNAQVKKLIREALAQLPKEDRAVITALYFENISIHKLAKQLGVSRAAVRYKRKRALEIVEKLIRKSETQN